VTSTYTYRREVLEQLWRHGLNPLSTTAPRVLRDAINDLYRYEIRRLRDELLANRIEKRDYAGRVIELRKRYLLLSVPIALWLEQGSGEDRRAREEQ
jgi:hypothetical protein